MITLFLVIAILIQLSSNILPSHVLPKLSKCSQHMFNKLRFASISTYFWSIAKCVFGEYASFRQFVVSFVGSCVPQPATSKKLHPPNDNMEVVKSFASSEVISVKRNQILQLMLQYMILVSFFLQCYPISWDSIFQSVYLL